MNKFESFEITEFNLKKDAHIIINACGLLKIMRSDDGKLILVGDADHGIISTVDPTPAGCADRIATLGFVLDIGMRQERMLTRGEGFYFGSKLTQVQSMRVIDQTDFDKSLFERIVSSLNSNYQIGITDKELAAMRLRDLFDIYNNARLFYPSYYNESYLNLMRIIDAVSLASGAYEFALAAAQTSAAINRVIFDKVGAIAIYATRLTVANDVFEECLKNAKVNKNKFQKCIPDMEVLDVPGRFVFSCFYSAYMYRNKFVHQGMPFPSIVKDAIGIEDDSGTAYLHPALGQSSVRTYRPTGLQRGDLIDIHEGIIGGTIDDFKKKYFLLIPTWHFLKRIAREALLGEIVRL